MQRMAEQNAKDFLGGAYFPDGRDIFTVMLADGSPKIAQDYPKTVPRSPKATPRAPQDHPCCSPAAILRMYCRLSWLETAPTAQQNAKDGRAKCKGFPRGCLFPRWQGHIYCHAGRWQPEDRPRLPQDHPCCSPAAILRMYCRLSWLETAPTAQQNAKDGRAKCKGFPRGCLFPRWQGHIYCHAGRWQPEDRPRLPQDSPKIAQDHSSIDQDRPKMAL